MKLFLDTNIVVDFVVCREPFADLATQIFQDFLFSDIPVYTPEKFLHK